MAKTRKKPRKAKGRSRLGRLKQEAENVAATSAATEKSAAAARAPTAEEEDWAFLSPLDDALAQSTPILAYPLAVDLQIPASSLTIPTPASQLKTQNDAQLTDALPIRPSILQLLQEEQEVSSFNSTDSLLASVPAATEVQWDPSSTAGSWGCSTKAAPWNPSDPSWVAAGSGSLSIAEVHRQFVPLELPLVAPSQAKQLCPARRLKPIHYADFVSEPGPERSRYAASLSTAAGTESTPTSVLKERSCNTAPRVNITDVHLLSLKQTEAAAMLGVSIQTLRQLCRESGITRWPRPSR